MTTGLLLLGLGPARKGYPLRHDLSGGLNIQARKGGDESDSFERMPLELITDVWWEVEAWVVIRRQDLLVSPFCFGEIIKR